VRFIDGIPIEDTPDVRALSQIKAFTGPRLASMVGHHKGYTVRSAPSFAYRDAISPNGRPVRHCLR